MTELIRTTGNPSLACSVAGDGPPVLFFHGVGGRRQNWERQAAHLGDRFTSIAWDARGYGDSDDYDTELRFADFADDVGRLLDHFEIEKAHMVGLSMGARIVMEAFRPHKDRMATLTLCDCFYGFDSALTPEKQEEYVALRERPLRSGKTFADLAPALIDSLVAPDCTEQARAELRASIEALRVEPYLKTIRASLLFDQSDLLGDIDMPVQLIFGELDRLTPPSIGQDMAEQIPDARLAVLDGIGHLSNLEAPEQFNQVLAEFLMAHRSLARFRS